MRVLSFFPASFRLGLSGSLALAVLCSGCAGMGEANLVEGVRAGPPHTAKTPRLSQVAAPSANSGFKPLPKRREAPVVKTTSDKKPIQISECLQTQLRDRLNLPRQFFEARHYIDDAQSVQLVNPFTHQEGIGIDIVPQGVGKTEIRLYSQGATLSRVWRQLPQKCR